MNYIKIKGSKNSEHITLWLNSLHFTVINALGVIYLCCLSTEEMPYDGECLGVSSQLHTQGVILVAWNLPWREYLDPQDLGNTTSRRLPPKALGKHLPAEMRPGNMQGLVCSSGTPNNRKERV